MMFPLYEWPRKHGTRRVDTKALARYIVAVIEGSIMLGRTQRGIRGMASNLENRKDYLKPILGRETLASGPR
jgi:hypothetical protein